MTPPFETERLLLRPLELADAEQVQAIFPQWEIVKYLANAVPWPYPPDGALRHFRDVALPAIARGEAWQWTLRLKSDPDRIIGSITLMSKGENNRGFWLAERYWNQGLMTEAVTAVNDFAFRVLGVDVLHFCNAVTNEASRRVKQKTGAEFVGFIEIAHHNGQTRAEKWRVTRKSWLRRD